MVEAKDLTGEKFGKLTVLSRADDVYYGNKPYIAWNCQCECGNQKVIIGDSLKSGATKTCGCGRGDKIGVRDLIGQRFGNLVVIKKDSEYIDKNGKRRASWLCKCDCGKTKVLSGISLKYSGTKSCGCLSNRNNKECSNVANNEKNTVLYDRWRGMLYRCRTHNRYAGRGIKVCEEWHDYNNFKKWALENGFNESLSLDRTNNNGDYAPDNCRWTSDKKQANNRSNTILLTYNGETHSLSEWADILDVPYNRLASRVNRGWEVKDIIENPYRGKRID